MVVRVCERARASGARSVTVATDDTRIIDAVEQCGFHALMTNAAHASGTDRLAEAARKLQLKESDIVVNVQGDEPLISSSLIRQVARLLSKARRAAVSTACHAIHGDATNPNVVKVVLDREGYALYFSRSQIPYPREAGAAVYRRARFQNLAYHNGSRFI